MSLTNEEKQDLRHTCLAALALNPRVAFSSAQIKRFCSRRLFPEPSPDDVADALQFLSDLGHAEKTPDPYGSELFYQITAEGTLANERWSENS